MLGIRRPPCQLEGGGDQLPQLLRLLRLRHLQHLRHLRRPAPQPPRLREALLRRPSDSSLGARPRRLGRRGDAEKKKREKNWTASYSKDLTQKRKLPVGMEMLNPMKRQNE